MVMVSPSLWVVLLLSIVVAVVVDSFSSPPSPTAHRHHRHRSNCRQYYSNRNNNKIIILHCGRSRSGGDTKRLVAGGGGIIRDDTATGLRLSNIDNGKTNRDAATNNDGSNGGNNIRLNKVFKATHSRRAADELICNGRVCVNGVRVTARDVGVRVTPYEDVITLDDEVVVGWEGMNYAVLVDGRSDVETAAAAAAAPPTMVNEEGYHEAKENKGNDRRIDINNATEKIYTDDERWNDHHHQQKEHEQQQQSLLEQQQQQRRHLLRQSISTFEYVKYYKPIGITCTTDPLIKDNIIHSICNQSGYMPKHRIYPVGRLDKLTSGLILLTSDGRLVNSVLRRENKYPKVYEVTVDVELTNEHINQLRNGIIIKTISQRSSSSSSNNDKGRDKNTLIARTRPCIVTRIIGNDDDGSSSSSKNNRSCRMTLIEGRNRQIRKMMGALGLTVISLRRIEFMGIQLHSDNNSTTAIPSSSSSSLKRPGDWAYLNKDEMKLIEDALWTVTEKER